MFLGNTLSSAASGLDSVERQFAIVSQNVSNADTPNYTRETVPLTSFDTAGGPAGVRTGATQRQIDLNVQRNLFAAVGDQSGRTVLSQALAGVDQASGQPNSGQDLSSLVGALQDSFSALTTSPSSAVQQLSALNSAGALVTGIHTLATTIVQARQAAQNSLQDQVGTVNDALRAIGTLSNQIVAAKSAGQSTAGLEDQRDADKQSLAKQIGARFVDQSDGGILVIAGNSVVPTNATSGPFSLGGVNFSGSTPATAVPALQLSGKPVTGLGGEVGANLLLRDTTLPSLQSELDGFAQSLASSFDAQNVPLFTDPGGTVPSSATLGFAATIQVSSAFQAAPTMLRDGTGPTLQSGDTSVIEGVLKTVFASSVTGIPAQASTLVASYAQRASQAANDATSSSALVSGLQSTLASVSGVSVDDEMSKMVALQNAYAANAKVVTAVQDMFNQLLQAVK